MVGIHGIKHHIWWWLVVIITVAMVGSELVMQQVADTVQSNSHRYIGRMHDHCYLKRFRHTTLLLQLFSNEFTPPVATFHES